VGEKKGQDGKKKADDTKKARTPGSPAAKDGFDVK
jgi:hypothetical protein